MHADGAALLGAVVNHLLQGRGARALVSTHFRELFDDAMLRLVTPSPETTSRLRFFHMEVLLDEREEEVRCAGGFIVSPVATDTPTASC